MESNQTPSTGGDLGTPLKIVSFCFPIVGLILYFIKKDNEPVASKQACTMALWGIGVGVVIWILSMVLGIGAGMMGAGS